MTDSLPRSVIFSPPSTCWFIWAKPVSELRGGHVDQLIELSFLQSAVVLCHKSFPPPTHSMTVSISFTILTELVLNCTRWIPLLIWLLVDDGGGEHELEKSTTSWNCLLITCDADGECIPNAHAWKGPKGLRILLADFTIGHKQIWRLISWKRQHWCFKTLFGREHITFWVKSTDHTPESQL